MYLDVHFHVYVTFIHSDYISPCACPLQEYILVSSITFMLQLLSIVHITHTEMCHEYNVKYLSLIITFTIVTLLFLHFLTT